MFYDTRDCGRMSSVTSSNDFIMQNHFVKKWDTLMRYASNYKKSTIFFVETFSNSTLYCVKLCSLLIKTKLIPFIYHKNSIRYSIFKYDA
jgi:hypothetical protein